MDYSGLNNAIIGVFGDKTVPITVFAPGGPAAFEAAFAEPYEGVTVGGVEVERPNPLLLGKRSDWEALGGSKGTKIRRGDLTYTVVDVTPDETGAVLLEIEAYDPDPN